MAFFGCQKRASNHHFLRPPVGPLLAGEGLFHVEFHGPLEDAQNWFVGSADIKNAFYQLRIPFWLLVFFALPAVLASEVGYTWETIDQNRLVPDSLIYFVLTTPPTGLSWVLFCCQDVPDHCTLTGSVDCPLFVYRDHSTHPLLGSAHGLGSVGFHWSYADNGGLARGADCTNVHLARLTAGVQRAGLYVHDISLASGSADVLGYEVSLATAYCSGWGKRMSRIRSVTCAVFAPSYQRSGALTNRGALNPSRKLQVRTGVVCGSGKPWSTVRK